MPIGGVSSIISSALSATAQTVESSTQIKPRTKKRLKKKAAPSPAKSNVALAKKHFKAGRKHYNNEKYEAALNEFQKSYGFIRILDMQYNIGLCYENLGMLDKAIEAFQLCLDGNPSEEVKEGAEAGIARIQTETEKQKEEEEPAGQTVAVIAPPQEQAAPQQPTQPVDTNVVTEREPEGKIHVPPDRAWQIVDQEEPSAPPPRVVAVTPPVEKKETPPALVVITPPARDEYIPPAGGTNETIGVVVKPSSKRPVPYRALMWTSVGLSSAALAAGVIGHLKARGKQAEHAERIGELERDGKITEQPNRTRDFIDRQTAATYQPELDRLEAEKNKYRTVAWAGFIGSAVFLGLGVTFYRLDKKQVRLSAVPTANGGIATIGGGF